MAGWSPADKAAGVGFARAAGEVEFQTDGAMVDTTAGGRREMWPGVFAKREPGGRRPPRSGRRGGRPGRRMKQTGARRMIRRANRMATLCCTRHGDAWDAYWKHVLT